MNLKQIFYFINFLIITSCNSFKGIHSEELKSYNLRGKVKSIEQKTYKTNTSSDSLKFTTSCDRCELHFSSYNFEKQNPDERGGIIGMNLKIYFDKKGRSTQMDFGYNALGINTKSYYFEIQSDGVNRVVKEIEHNKNKQIEKDYSYEIDFEKGKLITNGRDTTLHIESFIKNKRKTGNEERYTIYNEEGQYLERKNGYRLEVFEYDEKNRFIRSSNKKDLPGEDHDTEDIIEHFYREDKIKESNFYRVNWISKKRNLITKNTYDYDSYDNMIKLAKKSMGGRDETYELKIIEYDEFNNWILAEYFYNGKQFYLLKRDIVYY